VDFGFLDFSDALKSACRMYCAEEVRLNRRLAPDIYLQRRRRCAAHAGCRLHIDGAGPVLDHAVKMRAFPADATLGREARRSPQSRSTPSPTRVAGLPCRTTQHRCPEGSDYGNAQNAAMRAGPRELPADAGHDAAWRRRTP
jgi:aminoglycoside phosphotransferase family enzyme